MSAGAAPSARTIGLLGGMSWVSTIAYYRIVNETVAAELGGLHSANVLLRSVDFHAIETLQRDGRWDEAGRLLGAAAAALERGGAEFLVLCTNTMHRVAGAIEAAARIPLLHIADPTGAAVSDAGLARIGLLGTRFTMEEAFYKDRLAARHGIRTLIPPPEARATIHGVIYDELCHGEIRRPSREAFVAIANALVADGAQGIVLGCTEIGLLLGKDDVDVPLFDTTRLHAEAAARQSLPGRS